MTSTERVLVGGGCESRIYKEVEVWEDVVQEHIISWGLPYLVLILSDH